MYQQRISVKKREREHTLEYKMKRKQRRNKMFDLYEKHQEEKKYIHGQMFRKLHRQKYRAPATTSKSTSDRDHSHYTRNPQNNQLVRGKRQAGVCPPKQTPDLKQ